jgi:hypothetical protein
VPVPTPLPSGPVVSGGTDGEVAVWQPASDTVWEYLQVEWDPIFGYRTVRGGRINHLATNPGYQTDPAGWPVYAGSATALVGLATLQRVPELQRGVIDHAVGIGIPDPKFQHCWPAQANDPKNATVPLRDSRKTYNELIPEGTRFRLPPDLDIDTLGLTTYGAMVARAIQKYGLVVHDYSGAVTFYAEDWRTSWQSDPYPAIFGPGGPGPDGALANFPWDKLRTLSVPAGKPACGSDPNF